MLERYRSHIRRMGGSKKVFGGRNFWHDYIRQSSFIMSVKAFDLIEGGQRVRVWLLWDLDNCTIKYLGAREVIGPNGPVGDHVPGHDVHGQAFGPNGPGSSIHHNMVGDVNAAGDNIVGPELAEAGGNVNGEA